MVENELPPANTPASQLTEGQPQSQLKEGASRIGSAIRERAVKTGEARKDDLVDGLRRLVDKLEVQPGEQAGSLGGAGTRAADYLRRAERLPEENSIEELLDMAERQV